MRRGEVWWARLPLPSKDRPVVLLSRDEVYGMRAMATVAPVTSKFRGLRTEVRIGRRDGLRSDSVVNLDDIVTIPQAALDRRVTTLSPERLREIEQAIRFALSLPKFAP
jgi:mRNA interferase MazF